MVTLRPKPGPTKLSFSDIYRREYSKWDPPGDGAGEKAAGGYDAGLVDAGST
jgi:hypothetical protein